MPPLGQRIAIAKDAAFSFVYEHFLQDWYSAGAEMSFFAPLKDESPAADADAIFRPGGYPELHAEGLSQAARFRGAMVAAAARGTRIYGECGGFMVLGRSIVDAEGAAYPMLGLLPVDTSFAERNRTLGYRRLRLLGSHQPWPRHLVGHEFHYSTIAADDAAARFFEAETSDGKPLGEIGAVVGNTMGSYAHVIGLDPSRTP